MNKKDAIKKKSYKNYIELFFLCLIFSLFFIWLVNFFKPKINEEPILGNLFEIKYAELDGYVTERDSLMIFFSDSNNKNNEFDKKLKEYVVNKSLKNSIIYLDSSKLTIKQKETIEKQYFSDKMINSKISLNITPNILVFEKKRIIDILYKAESTYDDEDVNSFLMKHGFLEDD